MNQIVVYLTLEQVLVIHQDQVDRYGGSHGLRDVTLLESAVFRPQSSFSGQDLYSSVAEKAAALIHSLMFNHPFVDGNKRTAIVSGLVFLQLNGSSLDMSQDELVKTTVRIETEKWDTEAISKWISGRLNKVK